MLAKNERAMREMGKLAAQKGFTQEMKHDYMRLLMKALKTPMKRRVQSIPYCTYTAFSRIS